MTLSAQATRSRTRDEDDRYHEFLANVQRHFDATLAASPHLFTTNVTGLWAAYLDNAPTGTRQSRNCNCCRHFIERFGGLVTISDITGKISSAVWPENAPPKYSKAAKAMAKLVEKARVTGVFRASEATWGSPVTGKWNHIAVRPLANVRWKSRLTTASQEMASKLEEFGMIQRGLAEFSIETALQAHAILTSEALYRSEKVGGVGRWFAGLHEALAGNRPQTQENLLWLAVAKAPAGFCHVKSSMIGTLLEDIQSGLSFEVVKRKFGEKMNPLQYQRPQAPPTAGNAAEADKIIKTLEAEGALGRRFARLDDIEALWTPTERAKPKTASPRGLFGHLVPKASATAPTASNAPAQVMTWTKFMAIVLPTAEEIEFLVPQGNQPYTAMVTAKNPDAPNLLQWDNTVSHYMYSSGSLPAHWNLTGSLWRRVTAVSLRSWMWNPSKSFDHHGAGVVFVLEGCRDLNYVRSGGMFPEQMKFEYHSVRKTLEAYFNNAVIEGKDKAEACGISLVKGAPWNYTFRVTSGGVSRLYKLDRWD